MPPDSLTWRPNGGRLGSFPAAVRGRPMAVGKLMKSKRQSRKHPEMFGFLVAWLEERTVCLKSIDLVLPVHRNNWLRPQVEEKLASLDLKKPLEADLHYRVTQALELFEAVHSRHYRPPKEWNELEPWLCRAMAYFVQSGDAIPDHFEDGYEDDHREFVALGTRLGALLDHFDAWNRHFGRRRPPGA